MGAALADGNCCLQEKCSSRKACDKNCQNWPRRLLFDRRIISPSFTSPLASAAVRLMNMISPITYRYLTCFAPRCKCIVVVLLYEMTLLDSSNEILSHIAVKLGPEDLVNFVLACKDLRCRADTALRRHRKLLKFYTLVDDRSSSTLPSLLLRILSDPHVGHYVRELSVETPLHDQNTKFSEEELRLLKRSLLESCLLPEIEF